jgi:molybdopterin/thiamine biosynthesis adenylyltransferase
MAHLLQVGAGSGGMPVLDMLCRDRRLTRVTLIEPDVYKPHNVERHLFPHSAVGQPKAVLARQWLQERRPDLQVDLILGALGDPAHDQAIEQAAQSADLGVCAADNEEAKYRWDALMRRHRLPWTLGEVLSGGIGGFVHWFAPGGPCYGCVASHLQRSVAVDKAPTPDYSAPEGPVHEVTIPASKASISAIASLHALLTLALLDHLPWPREAESANGGQDRGFAPGFTTLLWTLQRVPDVFEEAFRPFRFRVLRAADCLICQARPAPSSAEELDVALDQALARLGDA